MSHDIPSQDDVCPSDDLGPELREAVDAVLHNEPPADWASETLERLRRQGCDHRQLRATPRKTSRGAKLIALAAVAASLVLVVHLEHIGVFEDVRRFAANVFTGPNIPKDGGPEDRQRLADGPPKPSTTVVVLADPDAVLPTLWVYRQAARRSPETLEALLDEHADRVLSTSSDLDPIGVWAEFL